MPSFMSISARVQELFRKNRGGGVISPPPPRRLRVKAQLHAFEEARRQCDEEISVMSALNDKVWK